MLFVVLMQYGPVPQLGLQNKCLIFADQVLAAAIRCAVIRRTGVQIVRPQQNTTPERVLVRFEAGYSLGRIVGFKVVIIQVHVQADQKDDRQQTDRFLRPVRIARAERKALFGGWRTAQRILQIVVGYALHLALQVLELIIFERQLVDQIF